MVLKGDGGGEQKGGAWVWASAPWDGPLPRPAASPPPSLTLCPPHPSVSPAILPSYPLLCSPLVCWVRGDGEEQRGRPQESGDRDSRPPAGTPGRPDPALRPLRSRSWRSEATQRLCGREAPLPSSESHSKAPSGRPRKVWVPGCLWDISWGKRFRSVAEREGKRLSECHTQLRTIRMIPPSTRPGSVPESTLSPLGSVSMWTQGGERRRNGGPGS